MASLGNKSAVASQRCVIPVEDCFPDMGYTLSIVPSEVLEISRDDAQLVELCDRLRELGYARFKRIRIYGQEFEVISNPFPEGSGIAVQALPKKETQARVLQLPLPILQMVTKRRKSD